MSKARDLADTVSTGGILDDGTVSVSEISDLTVTAAELNNVAGVNSDVQTQLDTKAPLASPSFTGNVGIGASSPARSLVVESDSNRVVNVKHTDGSSAYVTFSDNTTTDDGQVRIGAVGNDLAGVAGSVEGMRLTSTGLGIGTSSPARSLQVESTASNRVVSVKHTAGAYAYVTFSDNTTTDDGTVRIGALGNDLMGFVGGAERLRITSSGEFGIGGANYGTSGQVLTSGGSGAAPTWADAAGGGTVEMTASGGNISQGDIVALNSDGTITAIDVAGGDDILRSVVNPSAPVDVTTPYVTHILDTHYDSANSRIVCLIRNPSGYASAMVGVISNGVVTSWTTPVILYSSDSTDTSHDSGNLVYNSASFNGDFYLACFNRSNGWVWHAAFSVNSSNVITAHNEGEVGNFYWPDLAASRCNWSSTYNRFIGGGFSGNNNAFRFKNFDWSTSSSGFITEHGTVTTSGYATLGGAVAGPNGIIVAAFGNGNTLQMQAFWPGPSGQPPNSTSATSNILSGSDTLWSHPKIAYNSDDGEYVLIYNLYDGSGGYAVYAMPFTFIQGSGFTTNTPVQIANESISSSNQWDIVWSSDIQQYTLVVDAGSGGLDFPDGQQTTFTFTASASTGSVSALTQGYQVTTSPNEIRMFDNSALGTFGHIWNTTDLFSSVQTRVPKWVGIAKENITSGSSGNIYILGGVSPDQTGLTPRSTYYVSPSTNGLTTTATDNYKIGKALTSTKLLITEGNA